MSDCYRILLELLFPHFSRPETSRFTDCFIEIIKSEKINKRNNTSFIISIDKILNGEDKRTSIMLKNLPVTLTKSEITELLSNLGNINYIYLPREKYSSVSLGFAFVNFINYKNIIQVYDKLNGKKIPNYDMKRPIEICYSKIQGKLGLSQMFTSKK